MTLIEERTDVGRHGTPIAPKYADHPIPVTRKRLDTLLVGAGAVVTVVLVVAGALLTWGGNFAQDYVARELRAQNITFPDEAALVEEGRTDLTRFAGQQLSTGEQAEAYASYIAGHVANISGGQTYSELGGPQRAAQAAVTEAVANGASDQEIADLQATADELTAQRDTVFKGEMLRGTLLNTFAWSTIGRIAGIAATAAFVGAGVLLVLVGFGSAHMRRMRTV